MMIQKNRWFVGLATAFLTGPLSGGVVFEVETKDSQGVRSELIESVVEGKNLKMEIGSSGRGSKGEMIFRGDRREMVIVDHDRKTYMVIYQEAIKAIGAQMSQAMMQMEAALKNVPPEQRAMVEQMMKQRMPQAQRMPGARANRPSSELRKTGQRERRGGYPCVLYEVLRAGQRVREMWVTDWDNIEGGDEAAAAFEEMADFYSQMLSSFSRKGGSRGPGSLFDQDSFLLILKEVGGCPVIVREFENGRLEGESTLRSAQRRTLDPAAFEPPSGYKRMSMLGF